MKKRILTHVTALLAVAALTALLAFPASAAVFWDVAKHPQFSASTSYTLINRYACPLRLESYRTPVGDYDYHYADSFFKLAAPADGSYTFTLDSCDDGYHDGVLLHFMRIGDRAEYTFHYRNGQKENTFRIPDVKAGDVFRLAVLDPEDREPIDSTIYMAVCFDGYHFPGTLDDMGVAPTCTETGMTYTGCIYCKEVTGSEAVPAPGHDIRQDQMAPATCTQDGKAGAWCVRCGHEEDVVRLKAPGHVTAQKLLTPLQCGQESTVVTYCTVCGEEFEQTTLQGQHAYRFEAPIKPTCTEEGSYHLRCLYCRDVIERGVTPPLGHDFAWEWYYDPDESVLTLDRRCTHCSEIRRTAFPPLIVLAAIAALLAAGVAALTVLLVRKRRAVPSEAAAPDAAPAPEALDAPDAEAAPPEE